MIEIFSMEFWISILFIINFIFIIFLFLLVKKVNRINFDDLIHGDSDDNQEDFRHASGSAVNIIEILEPLIKESKKVALTFDEQIKEKKRLIKELNDALDSRIISINLLLSRADALKKKMEDKQNRSKFHSSSASMVFDQQNQIIDLYNKNFDVDSIAQKLSIPKGEVLLVVDLKKKFVAMEKIRLKDFREAPD
ncbi:MAG: hypothetical protein ABFR31_06245 [Thermodesulfobacteriota bacterium]